MHWPLNQDSICIGTLGPFIPTPSFFLVYTLVLQQNKLYLKIVKVFQFAVFTKVPPFDKDQEKSNFGPKMEIWNSVPFPLTVSVSSDICQDS